MSTEYEKRSMLLRLLPVLPVLLAVLVGFLGWRFYDQAKQQALQAVADGRVVSIDLATGKVGGAIVDPMKDQGTLLPAPGAGLAPAPAAHLSEKTVNGVLPKTGNDGTKPWSYYGRDFPKPNKPMIAIVVTGLGLNKALAEAAVRLPSEMTLSYTPYAKDVALMAASARALGHEVMVDLPMEPADFPTNDAGPKALLTMNSSQDNQSNLYWALSRFSGYVGVYTADNEQFTANRPVASMVFKDVGKRGLMAVFGNGSLSEERKDMLKAAGLPVVFSTVKIDGELSQASLTKQLLLLENEAHKQGAVLGVVQASPLSMRELAAWAEKLGQKGLILAPVTALARM